MDNQTVKIRISDIKKIFKVYEGMDLEIFLDGDVKISYALTKEGEE